MAKLENIYRICLTCKCLRKFNMDAIVGHGRCAVCGNSIGNIKLDKEFVSLMLKRFDILKEKKISKYSVDDEKPMYLRLDDGDEVAVIRYALEEYLTSQGDYDDSDVPDDCNDDAWRQKACKRLLEKAENLYKGDEK